MSPPPSNASQSPEQEQAKLGMELELLREVLDEDVPKA